MGHPRLLHHRLLWSMHDVREEVPLTVKEKMCYMIITTREVVLKKNTKKLLRLTIRAAERQKAAPLALEAVYSTYSDSK